MDTFRMSKIQAIKLLRFAGDFMPERRLGLLEAKNIVDAMERAGNTFGMTPPNQVEPQINQAALDAYVDATIAHLAAAKAMAEAEAKENMAFNAKHEARQNIIPR